MTPGRLDASLAAGFPLRGSLELCEILERSDDLEGTWRDNSYPGCAVDVQSHLRALASREALSSH